MYSWLFSTNSLPLQKNEVNKRSQKCNFIVKEKQKNEVQFIMTIIKVVCTYK